MSLPNLIQSWGLHLISKSSTSEKPVMMAPWKLKLFSPRAGDHGLTLIVESASGTLRPINLDSGPIYTRWKTLRETSCDEHWAMLEELVCECQRQHALGAAFGHRLVVSGEEPLAAREEMQPGLLSALPPLRRVLEMDPAHNVEVIPSSAISNVVEQPPSLSLGTSLVMVKGRLLFAKGPTRADAVENVFSELAVLASLGRHPSIIELPAALVVISPEDDRVLGYLLKYYPRGNLRDYVIQNRAKLTIGHLCKWSIQLARALRFMLYERSFTYVDIKPDNMLVDEHEDLILADCSNEGPTSWTCSPEVFHGYSIEISVDGKHYEVTNTDRVNNTQIPEPDTIPKDWPIEARDNAMVFSVGRTLWMTWEAIPAEKFLMANFAGEQLDRTVFTEATARVPQDMKDFVLGCVAPD